MSDIDTKIKKTFAITMNIDAAIINDNTSPMTLEEWDSLAHIKLILELEKMFSIKIGPDEAVELEDYVGIRDMVADKLAS